MREDRVIALAGVFQACSLVRGLATEGKADAATVESSLASVFRIDADSATDVFGGLGGVRLGLDTLIANLDGAGRDPAVTQLCVSALRLERKLASRPAMLGQLHDGIVAVQRQVDLVGADSANVQGRLGELYASTLSNLRPRIVVHGNPMYLGDARRVEQIRALLLAAVRAAVLWRQVGGSQWRLLLRRREYTMLARGLLARCTLDRG